MDKELYKEKISWYKLLFTISATALAACIGWLVANINFPFKSVVILNACAITGISLGMCVIVYKVRFYFKKIGEK